MQEPKTTILNRVRKSTATNLNQRFDENLNLKSIEDIDKHLIRQNEKNKHLKKSLAES